MLSIAEENKLAETKTEIHTLVVCVLFSFRKLLFVLVYSFFSILNGF